MEERLEAIESRMATISSNQETLVDRTQRQDTLGKLVNLAGLLAVGITCYLGMGSIIDANDKANKVRNDNFVEELKRLREKDTMFDIKLDTIEIDVNKNKGRLDGLERVVYDNK